jgi:hypothetical protein
VQENLGANALYRWEDKNDDLLEDVSKSCNINPLRLGVHRKHGSWYQLTFDGDPIDEDAKYNRLAFKNYLRGVSDGCKLV